MDWQRRMTIAVQRMVCDGFENHFRPAIVTEQLRAFATSIAASPHIQQVPIEDFGPRMLNSQCFNNCLDVISNLGGDLIHGWAWHQWSEYFLVAEFHAVWMSPDGQLIDVTPPSWPRSSTTFSLDPVRVAPAVVLSNPNARLAVGEPNRRFVLKDIADVHEWICAEDQNAAINSRRLERGEKVSLSESTPAVERNVRARQRLIERVMKKPSKR